MKHSLVVCLAMLAGCGASTSPLVETVDVDGGLAVDAGRRDAGPSTDGLVFRLVFRSDVGSADTFYVQEATSAREGPGWLTVRTAAGANVELEGRCDICDCPTSGGSCLDCPRCGPPPDIVRGLSGVGDVIEHRWDLRVHDTGTCASVELALCSAAPTVAPPGDYVATFCGSGTTSGIGPGQVIGTPECVDVAFHLPDDDGIVGDVVCWCG
jgi:hypothetical protein